MPIVSSTFVEGIVQADGRRQVTETHTDQLGLTYTYNWLAEDGTTTQQIQTIVTNRAPNVEAFLRNQEIAGNIARIKEDGQLAVTHLDYSTIDQNFAELREQYKTATEVEAIFMADFLSARTDTQLRNLFGYTQTQVNNLRTNKLTPAANAAATIRATTGVA